MRGGEKLPEGGARFQKMEIVDGPARHILLDLEADIVGQAVDLVQELLTVEDGQLDIFKEPNGLSNRGFLLLA